MNQYTRVRKLTFAGNDVLRYIIGAYFLLRSTGFDHLNMRSGVGADSDKNETHIGLYELKGLYETFRF